jgi:hypothetical protein
MTRADTDIHSVAFFSADHAAVESGKAYVSGAFWNRLNVATFPSPISLGIVAVLHVPWHAYHKKHVFQIALEDADGRRLPVELKGEFQVGSAPDMKVGDPTLVPIATMLNGLPIERPGTLSFVLLIDGGEIDRWRIDIVHTVTPMLGTHGGPASIPEIG